MTEDSRQTIRIVIPAKAGIQTSLDTRFRGYDVCFDYPPEFWILTSGSLLYALCSMPYAVNVVNLESSLEVP